MDALRSGDRLEPSEKVCQVLLRASDMMSALIEVRAGATATHERKIVQEG